MSNYSDLVFKELSGIANSMSNKKKYSVMRDALQAFQSYLEANKSNGISIPKDELEKLLKPAISIPSAKFHIVMISFLLKMINLRVIHNIEIFKTVIDYFLAIKEIQKDHLQVKLQQSFINLVQPEYFHFSNYEFIEKVRFNLYLKCLTMVLFMKTSRIPIIAVSAESVVQKIIELLSLSTQLIIGGGDESFDKLELQLDLQNDAPLEEQKQRSDYTEIKQQDMFNLQRFLQDLVLVIEFKRPNWYPLVVPVDREFGLASMNTFVKNMGKFFLNRREIDAILRQSLFPVLIKLVQTPSNMIKQAISKKDQYQAIECFKCLVSLIEVGPVNFLELWETIDQLLHGSEHSLQKNLAFQTLTYFMNNGVYLQQLMNDKNDFFLGLYTYVSGLAKEYPIPSEMDSKKWSEMVNPVKNLQHPSNDECPISDGAFILRMLSEIQLRLAQSLCVYSEQDQIPLGTRIKLNTIEKCQPQIQVLEKIWKIAHRCIRYLLLKESEEGVTQNALNSVQAFINLFGTYQMRGAQDQFVKVICEFCLPKAQQTDFNKRHIQINKMVLNIGNCLGNLLECSCWITIFKTFRECENFYNKNRLAKDTSQEEQLKTQDIYILFQSLDQIFTQSGTYESEHLLLIMDALNQVTIESLELNQVDQSNTKITNKQKTFSLVKLVELVRANLHRLDLFWELIIAHFICVASSRNTQITADTVDTLCQIIFMSFSFLQKIMRSRSGAQEETNFLKDKWKEEDGFYQQTLLQPLVDLCALRSTDIKEQILGAFLKLLQNNGHELMKFGWDSVLCALTEISSEQTFIYVKQGLQATEYIINHFLASLNQSQIEKLFEVIENFKQNSQEQNINFQICNMLWHVGDFLNKQEQFNLEQFISRVFTKLSQIAMDSVTEIRHSAIHIFTNLLMHSTSNSYEYWKKVLDTIFYSLMHNIIMQYQDNRVGNEADAHYWEETVKSIIQASLKLFKRYFSIPGVEELDVMSLMEQFLPMAIQAMKQYRSDILLETVHVIRELFQSKPAQMAKSVGFQEVLVFLERLYTTPPQDIKLLKSILLKVIPEVIDLLSDAFKQDIGDGKLFFTIYEKILLFPLVADMTYNLAQNKIFYNEDAAIGLLQVQIAQVDESNSEWQQNFRQLCQRILQIQPTNQYQNTILSRFVKELCPSLFQIKNDKLFYDLLFELSKLIKMLRVNQGYLNFQQTLKGQPIWIEAALCLASTLSNTRDLERIQKNQKIIQDLLPNKIHFQQEDLAFTEYNRQMLDSLVRLSAENYHRNPILYQNEELLSSFLQNIQDLATLPQLAYSLLEALISMLKDDNQVMKYFLEATQSLLDQYYQNLSEMKDKEKPLAKVVTFILSELAIFRTNPNSFKGEYPDDSPLQSEIGLQIYLLPQLSNLILSNDYDTRKQVQVILNQISSRLLQH